MLEKILNYLKDSKENTFIKNQDMNKEQIINRISDINHFLNLPAQHPKNHIQKKSFNRIKEIAIDREVIDTLLTKEKEFLEQRLKELLEVKENE